MIDYWKLTKDFKVGDTVQRFVPSQIGLSPFSGRVTCVHLGIGFVDVQWPFGQERVSPEEIVRINPDLTRYLPPTLNQTYSSWDTSKCKQASSQWRNQAFPPSLYMDLAQAWAKGAGEVAAYDDLYRRYGSTVEDALLRDEVQKFYRVARNLMGMRIHAHAYRTAAYWVAQNRQYRVTQREVKSRAPSCPKCGTPMRKTTYKMEEGSRIRLFACPQDLFLIKSTNILGPEGAAIEW